MADRLTRIYTRTGDKGTTGLANGSRVKKTHPRIEALGTIDELNSSIGLLQAELTGHDAFLTLLSQVQHDLFDLGGEIAVAKDDYIVMGEHQTKRLEASLDTLNQDLPPLKEFILPAGGRAGASCHLARSICRRAERRVIELADAEEINPHLVAYVNRLSDLLFVLARAITVATGHDEVFWKASAPKGTGE
ncbi:MAG: cob(I)yrinic acid a,c-diamide adenosyltransferase [Pontibacterium sp.]